MVRSLCRQLFPFYRHRLIGGRRPVTHTAQQATLPAVSFMSSFYTRTLISVICMYMSTCNVCVMDMCVCVCAYLCLCLVFLQDGLCRLSHPSDRSELTHLLDRWLTPRQLIPVCRVLFYLRLSRPVCQGANVYLSHLSVSAICVRITVLLYVFLSLYCYLCPYHHTVICVPISVLLSVFLSLYRYMYFYLCTVMLLLSTPLHQRAASRVQHPKSCGSQQSLPPGGKERLHFVGIRPEVQARKGGW